MLWLLRNVHIKIKTSQQNSQGWHLIAWQHNRQPIKSHVRKSLFTNMGFQHPPPPPTPPTPPPPHPTPPSAAYMRVSIGSGMSPGRRQVITWTDADLLSIWSLGMNYS